MNNPSSSSNVEGFILINLQPRHDVSFWTDSGLVVDHVGPKEEYNWNDFGRWKIHGQTTPPESNSSPVCMKLNSRRHQDLPRPFCFTSSLAVCT
ncbi:hypothetical protein VNO77_15409 [Canavalia gladiata]|uniref:Uncharacterized protein n=1 Tax=Canavalia gladiata TaxID=3824 RepID=A0AAN9LZ10_CANGL